MFQLQIDKRKLTKISEKFGLSLVIVFGSYASGKTHQSSDLDIAVKIKDQSQIVKIFLDLNCELQELFPKNKIDLAFINHADPLFLKKISEQCILIFGNETDFNEFKAYAYKRFIDHKKYLEMEKSYVDKVIGKVKFA